MKVPHDQYTVEQFDGSVWTPATASVICNTQQTELYPSETVTDCNMFVKQTVLAGAVGFTKLTYNATSHLAVDTCSQTAGSIIESNVLSLKYTGSDSNQVAYFDLTDKTTQETNSIGFSLKYWQEYQRDPLKPITLNHQKDGAYIFRPTYDQFESWTYSQVEIVESKVCDAKQQFIVKFTGVVASNFADQIEGDAIVSINVIEDLSVLKVDVTLFGLPINNNVG